MHWSYTPTYRGFDSFFGFYGAGMYYYEHLGVDDYYQGYDFRANMNPYNEHGTFSLDLFETHTLTLIEKLASTSSSSSSSSSSFTSSSSSSDTKPFFLYIGWQG